MEWFNDPQFLYLMGVLWIINGTLLYVVAGILKDDNNAMTFVCWLIGMGHIIAAFAV